MADSPWGEHQNPLAIIIPITSTFIRLDFPAGRYLADEPVVMVTVSGARTEVTITSPKEAVAGLGEIHTHIGLAFPADLVGERAHVWVMGR